MNLYPYLSGIENLDYFSKLAGLTYKKSELSNFLIECGLEQQAHAKRTQNTQRNATKVGIAIAYAKMQIYLLMNLQVIGPQQ